MKIKVILLATILCFLSITLKAIESNVYQSPEQFLQSYFLSFDDITFKKSAKFLHPDLLSNYKNQIIEMISRTSSEGQTELLSNFGVKTINDLKLINEIDLYAIGLSNRLDLNTPSKRKGYINLIHQTKYNFLVTQKISDSEYQFEVNSELINNPKQISKIKKYTVVKVNNEWKIFKINQ